MTPVGAPSWSRRKYPAERKTVTIKSIRLQTGRTGAITPIAEFDPVQIGGTMVSNATLHNQKFITAARLETDTLDGDGFAFSGILIGRGPGGVLAALSQLVLLFDNNKLLVRVEVYQPVDAFLELNKQQEACGLEPYSNPRNCASGGLRADDPEITRARGLRAFAFRILYAAGPVAAGGAHDEFVIDIGQCQGQAVDLLFNGTGEGPGLLVPAGDVVFREIVLERQELDLVLDLLALDGLAAGAGAGRGFVEPLGMGAFEFLQLFLRERPGFDFGRLYRTRSVQNVHGQVRPGGVRAEGLKSAISKSRMI